MNTNSALVYHVPHSSTTIPPKLRSRLVLTDEELSRELTAMTDLYTDELFALPTLNGRMVRFPISRLIVDPERFVDDNIETMARRGMGVIYTQTSGGALLRNAPSARERAELIAEFYNPHHEDLNRAVDYCLSSSGICVVLDCHSFSKYPLPYEQDQEPVRPDICLGTDDIHTPPWIGVLAKDQFKSAGYSVEFNRPYPGVLVPSKHYRVTPNVYALMIEINRGLYMDCLTGERNSDFTEFKLRFQGILSSLLNEVFGFIDSHSDKK